MKFNVLGLEKAVYAALFAVSLMASAATFGAVAMGFELHQRHVAQAEWTVPRA
jgi:hypothetical protein